MKQNRGAHWALAAVAAIYGLNFTLAKDVMPEYIGPFGFILIRATGAVVLFWMVSAGRKREPLQRKDLPLFALCGLLGVAANQLLFFKGLELTGPINGSLLMTITPLLALVLAALYGNEPLSPAKIAGLALAGSGALLLIGSGIGQAHRNSNPLGDTLILINAASYAAYMVAVKPLMQRYSPRTVTQWVFIFGWFMVLPFGWSQFNAIQWSQMPPGIYARVAYVVVFTTFFAYLLNSYGISKLGSGISSLYVYLQPLFATAFALLLGSDQTRWVQLISALLIGLGVLVAGNKRYAQQALAWPKARNRTFRGQNRIEE